MGVSTSGWRGVKIPKPRGFEKYLGDYEAIVFDEECGEPVGWGFEIVGEMSEERYDALKHIFTIEFGPPASVLVLRLGCKEATEKYGAPGPTERGPRAGFVSLTFGETKFTSRCVAPENQRKTDIMAEKEQERRDYG